MFLKKIFLLAHDTILLIFVFGNYSIDKILKSPYKTSLFFSLIILTSFFQLINNIINNTFNNQQQNNIIDRINIEKIIAINIDEYVFIRNNMD